MSPESEGDRDQRIRDAQLASRERGGSQKAQSSPPRNAKKKVVSKSKNQPSQAQSGLLSIPLGGVRDIVIGVAIALIPSILAFVLLPGVFRLLAVLILAVGAGVGYLMGNQTK